MTRWRLHLRLLSWITTFVVLFGSMAPAISSSLAWAGSAPLLADICTAGGSAGTSPTSQPGEPGTSVSGHCPFCLLQPHGAGLPPTVGTPPRPMATAQAVVIALRAGPPSGHTPWQPAAPRGPPAHTS